MSNKSISGLSCAEAASICEKTEYQEASTWERLKLKLHLFFCKTCKNYYDRNKKLTDLLQKSNLKTCSKQEKEVLKQRLNEKSEVFKSQQEQ